MILNNICILNRFVKQGFFKKQGVLPVEQKGGKIPRPMWQVCVFAGKLVKMRVRLIELRSMLKSYGRVISLLLMMVLGTLLPQLNVLSFLVQYFLMLMLFFAFLDIEIHPRSIPVSVLWVLLANIVIAILAYGLLSLFDPLLALAGFVTAIAPTAIAAPVIIGFIDGQVDYVVGSVLLTNVAMALVVPVVLPFLVGKVVQVTTWQVLQPVVVTMFVPLVLARLVGRLPDKVRVLVGKGKAYAYPLWLANLIILSAKAADFVRTEWSSAARQVMWIALISMVICAVNFSVGALIGGRRHWQESSQSLGQKNNSFVIWIALTFIHPIVALGPTFYVLFHNLYNSWQIYRFEKRGRSGKARS